MENLVIGIIDDDQSKVTQIITHLCSDWQSSTDSKLSKSIMISAHASMR